VIEIPEGTKPIHPQAALHSRVAVDARSSRTAPPRHKPVPEFHWGLANMLNPSFDYELAVNAVRAAYAARVLAVNGSTSGSRGHFAMLAVKNLPACASDEMWAVVDCGATHHYHPTRLFMMRIQEINVTISGLTGPGPKATGFGLFLGMLEAYDRRDRQVDKFFSSVSYHVLESTLPLFSEVQAAFSGCKIILDGHPETGQHGIFLTGDDRDLFVPYTFEKTSLLWWIKIKKAPEAICLKAAVAMDPAKAPCQRFMRLNTGDTDAAEPAANAATATLNVAAIGDPTGTLKRA